jgi:hypothetical protein
MPYGFWAAHWGSFPDEQHRLQPPDGDGLKQEQLGTQQTALQAPDNVLLPVRRMTPAIRAPCV